MTTIGDENSTFATEIDYAKLTINSEMLELKREAIDD